MDYDFTSDEAFAAADAVLAHFSASNMTIRKETAAWQDAPYKTTVTAQKAGMVMLVEAQGRLEYHKPLKDFAQWLAARRHNCELYIAVRADADMPVKVLQELRKDGVGLLVTDDNDQVTVEEKARNPRLTVAPDPSLKYGHCKKEVEAAINKFNNADRKDGLRDMCEIVERETKSLALLLVRRGHLDRTVLQVQNMDWSNTINMLAAQTAYKAGHAPIIDDDLKGDFQSFRSARNLVDHPAHGHRKEVKRQQQYVERMMMGPRLLAETIARQRKVKR